MDSWERMKPLIEQLYIVERMKLRNNVLIMKADHDFDAVEHQYKHHFKKWKWRKTIPKAKAEKIAAQVEIRASAGKSGTIVSMYGREGEGHKIRRYLKGKSRTIAQTQDLKKPFNCQLLVNGPVLPFSNTFFLKWNLPYAAMRQAHTRSFDHTSPFELSVLTPGSDMNISTPPSTIIPTKAPSPTAMIIKENVAFDRARMFAQGQHEAHLASITQDETRKMSNWLYEYWFFCFKTTKEWGRGLRAWDAELLDFDRYQLRLDHNLPDTLHDFVPRPEATTNEDLVPTDLCRWFIHVGNSSDYGSKLVNESEPDEEDWPEDLRDEPLLVRLRDALEHKDFALIPTATLPVAIPGIARAAERSPDELQLEALGFSIMSRNEEQTETILGQLETSGIDCKSLFPLHMVTSYLDGARTCCTMFGIVSSYYSGSRITEVYVNELGHTIIDNLMVSILKSHSSARPCVVDQAWRDNPRFCGEEVDICGRWDADSPCVPQQHANGNPTTPIGWKHKSCHSSIQTIYHCMVSLFANVPERLIRETASGLYVQRCFKCGTKLQIHPLHSLVITAYHLASKGCEGEDLFGMLACLLCLVSCKVNLRLRTNVSVNALLGNDVLACDHEHLTAAELAEKISTYSVMGPWSIELRSGWAVFCGVLSLCERNYAEVRAEYGNRETQEDDGLDKEKEDWADLRWGFVGNAAPSISLLQWHADHRRALVCLFRKRKDLGTLWASIQAELLAYRRLHHGADWLSRNFSMKRLADQLNAVSLCQLALRIRICYVHTVSVVCSTPLPMNQYFFPMPPTPVSQTSKMRIHGKGVFMDFESK